MTFCSSFGQTYFISLFGGAIRADFDIGHGTWGACYSAGTLASAAVLVWAGRLIDRKPLVVFSVAAASGLAAATALMAGVAGLASLVAAFFALRIFGQGLMMHAAMTAMGRYFSAQRGRAVSFASLGHVCGEAVLPLAAVGLMTMMHWRSVWLLGTAVLLCVAVPLILVLLSGAKLQPAAPEAAGARTSTVGPRIRDATLGEAMREAAFYLRLPVMLAPAFIATGLIFHQVHIGTQKGWSLTLIAGSLSVFALGSLAAMLAAGALVDRRTARGLLPYCLAPFMVSCAILALGDSTAAALAFFGLLGAGSGLSAVILGAIWPELYGITHLGAIRAFGTSAMVFSSGLAPVAYGLLIDGAWSVAALASASLAACVAASVLAWIANRLPATCRPGD